MFELPNFAKAWMLALYIYHVALQSSASQYFDLRQSSGETLHDLQGQVRSLLGCGSRCDMSSSCKAFCYSRSTALCYLSSDAGVSSSPAPGSDYECYDARSNTVQCPAAAAPGYAIHGTRCLKVHQDKMDYYNATSLCAQAGGHLFHYKSLPQDRQAIDALQAAEAGAINRFWVGADDMQTEGQFLWSDSTVMASDLWSAPQPDAATPYENCVEFYNDHKFNDINCNNLKKSVCQIDV